jgi:hypothetical protein
MANQNGTDWRLKGEELGSCNCDWGCPCQFDALPTHGRCEGMGGWLIEEGYFGDTRLDGVRMAMIYWWPGPIHEGEGFAQLIIDEETSEAQREALIELFKGGHGGGYLEIFAAVCPNRPEPIVAPISLEINREARLARLDVPGIMSSDVEPIKTRVTGEEHRVQIALPGGFEFTLAEMGNTTALQVELDAPLKFDHNNCYAQLAHIDWSGDKSL